MIRSANDNDVGAICGIYNHYIEHTVVSFEEAPVSHPEMLERMQAVMEEYPWLVFESNEGLLGYAYASAWHGRTAYRFAAESTVYLHPQSTGQGVGTRLYEALIAALKEQGLRTVLGGIALPNPASVALHEKMGFVQAAHYKQVGWKHSRWIDVGYWQLMLEPRG